MKNFQISKICTWVGIAFFSIYLILMIIGFLNLFKAENYVIVFFGITGLLLISSSVGIRMNLKEGGKQDLEIKKEGGCQ